MAQFTGFPEGKTHLTPMPGQFFDQLLPLIDDLAELKITLYTFWLLDHMEGNFRYLIEDDFQQDETWLYGLCDTPGQEETVIQDALARAVRRGTLLQASIATPEGDRTIYFLNSPRGRLALQAVLRGDWRRSGDPRRPVDIWDEPPNIFRLYEENIGPLTPLIADALRDAEQTYPLRWIEDATRLAVTNNARSWRYIETILKRWQREGRDERKDRPDTEEDRRRYIQGEYADFIEH